MSKKSLTNKDVVQLLNPETFQTKNSDHDHGSDPLGKTQFAVTLDQLVPYNNNPRQSRNPKFDEIKESIRNRGLDQPPKITRRHASDKNFMIKSGGNTRLEILRELYEETDDERFYRIECQFEPWINEIDTMAGHMAENEQRGDLLFIEKASAAIKMRQLFEAEEPGTLSGRELAKKITMSGWTLGSQNLTRYEYAANTLLPFIPVALWAGAGRPVITRLRKLDTTYRKYWLDHERGQELGDSGFELLWHEALKDHDTESLDLAAIQKTLDIEIGKQLQIHYQTVAIECDAIASGKPLTSLDSKIDTTHAPSAIHSGIGALEASPLVSRPATDPVSEKPMPGPILRPQDKLEQLRQRVSQSESTLSASPPPLAAEDAAALAAAVLASLRDRTCQLAQQLAEAWDIGHLIEPVDFGSGFLVTAPNFFLEDQDPQGGVFMHLYRMAACGLFASGDTTKIMQPELILKLAFENPFFASFADIICTQEILVLHQHHDDKLIATLTELRTGFRELEDLVIAIAIKEKEMRRKNNDTAQ
ncbi:MAG: ParB N-terminal domain-containing protein [Gammaproteobacteria bacterium]|nr:ParB N-terminal domain-containing protein [Gammaproteobacteria bacterium]